MTDLACSHAHHLAAQDAGDAWVLAAAELRRGRKTGHWMWFVFPQLAGLGRSDMARRFAITDLEDARSYLAHPILGPRLLALTRQVIDGPSHDPVAIFGPVDAMKLRSCLTLFQAAADGVDGDARATFTRALAMLYDGLPCARTRALLADEAACD